MHAWCKIQKASAAYKLLSNSLASISHKSAAEHFHGQWAHTNWVY